MRLLAEKTPNTHVKYMYIWGLERERERDRERESLPQTIKNLILITQEKKYLGNNKTQIFKSNQASRVLHIKLVHM
jgi:hypothetical protein